MKLPNFLKYLLNREEYRLGGLAEKAGVHASDLSKIINGKRVCGHRMMIQIIHGLKAEHQAAALAAWLKDQVPDEFTHMVHVVAGASRLNDCTSDLSSVEGVLDFLGKEASKNVAVENLLKSLADTFSKS